MNSCASPHAIRTVRRRTRVTGLCLAIVCTTGIWLASGCGDSSAERRTVPDASHRDGTLQLLLLNRLRGMSDGIPCQPDSMAPLPAAARLRDALRSGTADPVLMAIVGDTLVPSEEEVLVDLPVLHALAAARRAVHLKAVLAARPDVWVPGHADLQGGALELLEAARDAGVPILLSNVQVASRPDLPRHLLLEVGGVRIGLLGVLPPRVTDVGAVARGSRGEGAIAAAEYPGLQIMPVAETVAGLAAELRSRHEVQLVAVLSTLGAAANVELAGNRDISFIIGGAEQTLGADRVYILGESVAVLSSLHGDKQVGHFTLRVEQGSLAFDDLTPRHALPAQIAQQQARIGALMQQFGTRDLLELARRVAPDDPNQFIAHVERIAENVLYLESLAHHEGSSIEWRPAGMEPLPPDDPIAAIGRTLPGALRAALSSPDLPPPVPGDLSKSLIPPAESCAACHATQFRFWERTAHAKAVDSLRRLDRGQDATCLSCHAAGYAEPAGWFDPRLDAPLGGVSCWQCHQASALHGGVPRLVTDPQHVRGSVDGNRCLRCHTDLRSPGFDVATQLPKVSCPPMRSDEPAVLLARQSALQAIAVRRAEGRADARDTYLEGRALIGLGRVEEGSQALEKAARDNPSDVGMAVEIARLLDEAGRSRQAQLLIERFLAGRVPDAETAQAYLELLLNPREATAARPAEAAAYLDLLLPKSPEESRRAMVDLRLLQIEAYFRSGRASEARTLLTAIYRDHRNDARVAALAARHGFALY